MECGEIADQGVAGCAFALVIFIEGDQSISGRNEVGSEL